MHHVLGVRKQRILSVLRLFWTFGGVLSRGHGTLLLCGQLPLGASAIHKAWNPALTDRVCAANFIRVKSLWSHICYLENVYLKNVRFAYISIICVILCSHSDSDVPKHYQHLIIHIVHAAAVNPILTAASALKGIYHAIFQLWTPGIDINMITCCHWGYIVLICHKIELVSIC